MVEINAVASTITNLFQAGQFSDGKNVLNTPTVSDKIVIFL